MFQTKLYSEKWANAHFWMGTLGIAFYAIPMYWAGFTQHFMWKEFTADGFLAYPNFLETVTQIIPMYLLRAVGGGMYIVGMLLMIANLVKTIKAGSFLANEEASAPALVGPPAPAREGENWHRWIERRPIQMVLASTVLILIGGLVEFVPTATIKSNIPTLASVMPYTPLELQGRDVYITEGCNNCHSQMIRPFRWETERYGEYSKAGEFVYDHPFLWGSKRTGPDLARSGYVNGKMYKPDSWHFNHMYEPRSTSPGSIMPAYPWLYKEGSLDTTSTAAKIKAMRKLGVPYEAGYEELAAADLRKQAQQIAKGLRDGGLDASPNTDIVALIAYLQRLGVDIMKDPEAPANEVPAPDAPATDAPAAEVPATAAAASDVPASAAPAAEAPANPTTQP
jgi:cytochrome c oxidase cbb3-type subunit I/II